MALNNLGLGFTFRAKDLASGTIRGLSSSFGTMDKQAAKAQKSMTAAFVTLATGAVIAGAGVGAISGFFGLAEKAGQFEQSLAGVGAITRATSHDLVGLREAAIQAGIATQFSPDEAVAGLEALSIQGFNAREAMDALNPALDLAAGGQISVAQAAQTTASALRVFQLETDQAAITTDKLLAITQRTSLRAQDLEVALGNVSRGAGLTKQSIDQMLPSIGLVRNTGVDASVAANAVSSALIFMSKNAKKFRSVGVEVTDAQGKFRPFLDLVMETRDALANQFPDAADRASFATELFGRFGIVAANAVGNQLAQGVRDSTGTLYQNAEAIRFLEGSMRGASGTAAEFREKLLDTFEGQKTLLRGTLETLGVVFGEPFGRVFRPFVTAVADGLNLLIRAFKSLPKGLQTTLAAVAVGVATFAAFAGVIIAVKAAMLLLAPFAAVISVTFASISAAVIPVVAGIAAVVAVVGLLSMAFTKNLGGIGDSVRAAFDKVKLVFEGIGQLISQGGFSGAVREEFSKAENQGIRAFVVRVGQLVFRAQRFFEGISDGFVEAMNVMEPVFGALGEAFRMLGDALAEVGIDMLGSTKSSSSAWAAAGGVIGRTLAAIASGLAFVITVAVRVATVFIQVAGFISSAFGSVRDFVADVLSTIFNGILEILGLSDRFTGFLRSLGVAEVPRTIERGINGRTRGTANAPQLPSQAASPPAQAASAGVAALAAAAQETARNTPSPADLARHIGREMRRQPLQVRSTLSVDGEVLAEATERARRGSNDRSGIPVGEE